MDMKQEQGRYAFVVGLVAGTCVGAGLTMWLAPRGVAELGRRLTDSARDLGQRASQRYDQASGRLNDAADELTRKGQDVRDDVAGAVARGAHEVEQYATAAMSGRH